MEQLPVTSECSFTDGELVPLGVVNTLRKDGFLSTLKEGDKVNVTYEVVHANKSYAQLALVHKCIRTLATETGDTFEKMKEQIKERSGLCMVFGPEKKKFYRSFGDCSIEELSHSIQACLELGEFLNVNLHQI